jgi:hypothetical protein
MKRLAWLSVGLVLTIAIASAAYAAPAFATSLKGGSPSAAITAGAGEPNWNMGNACAAPDGTMSVGTYNGHPYELCNVEVSGSSNPFTGQYNPVMLWWNFSAGETQGMIFTVQVFGSVDCLTFNFHGFYGTVDLILMGSQYVCPSQGGVVAGVHGQPAGAPGVNVAINSEGDNVTVIEAGSAYASTFYVYGTTTSMNFLLGGSVLTPTVFFIGTTAGFGTCPSGITAGRVYLSAVSGGSYNTLNTIWIDGTNVVSPPANVPYYTTNWWPIDGGLGYMDYLGFEVTQSAPAGSCSYL